MLVERAIWPFAVHRKNSLFFSCEEGVETALTFSLSLKPARMSVSMPGIISRLQLGS
ncbi:hypothetical protein FSA05_12105 [Parabacteroides distasonis]|uniref:Uncharacterized protein n=1 Tax=Parabacteroides distasonis TaxID=823 RepID=A0A5C6KDF6_PARDI|nr:hypothetical protein FSA05_12105 [Parabacteroides distasonis]